MAVWFLLGALVYAAGNAVVWCLCIAAARADAVCEREMRRSGVAFHVWE